MPRGKNYVNNNRGLHLQGKGSKANMKVCEYGAACTRPDCIYRHDVPAKKEEGKREEVCLPFLAGKCSFKDGGCRKRHPKKDEKARLIAKYKRTRCRFGDECYTDGCLYLHPREMDMEPRYVEPHNVAFPPLNGAAAPAAPKPIPNSAWKATPMAPPQAPQAGQPMPTNPQPPQQQLQPHDPNQQQPQGVPPMGAPMPNMGQGPPFWMDAPMYPPYFMPQPYFDPSMQGHPMAYYPPPHGVPPMMNFNAEAKEFVPENQA